MSPFHPDKMHLHHRLLEIGHSHRRVVLLIYLWVGIVALGAASTIFVDPRYTGAVMLAAILVAVVATLIPLVRGAIGYTTKSSRPTFRGLAMWYGSDRRRHPATTKGAFRSFSLGVSCAPTAVRYARQVARDARERRQAYVGFCGDCRDFGD